MISPRVGYGASVIAWLAVAAPALAQNVTVSCPGTMTPAGARFVAEVTVDIGQRPLGAYNFALTYNPAVVRVESITGGTTAEFSTDPITNPTNFPSGRTRFAAFNTASLTSPTGAVSVARVTFESGGLVGDSSPIGVEIITLADTDGSRITAEARGCVVTLGSQTPGGATETPTPQATATPTSGPTETPAPTCPGDCGGDGSVTVEEILMLVNVALGNADVSVCTASDLDANEAITIEEILTAVNMALTGCSAGGN